MERKLKPGDRVRVSSMQEEPDPMPLGALGTSMRVHDQRDGVQVEVAGDNGRGLMVEMPDDCVAVGGDG